MHVARTIDEVRVAVAEARGESRVVGCVMTMGALHEGHLSLLTAAAEGCDFCVATVFVNPTQFAPNEDFDAYPRTLDDDLAMCEESGVDCVFVPTDELMYPHGHATSVLVAGVAEPLEGRHRPGHFAGVATVVLKLLNIVRPDTAYFGQKDYQQVAVIRRMVADLNVPVEVAVCPTVREEDGLAMSSRNRRLTSEDREAARLLSYGITQALDQLREGQDAESVRTGLWSVLTADERVTLEYASVADPESLEELDGVVDRAVVAVAARVGTVRLIDNMLFERTSETPS